MGPNTETDDVKTSRACGAAAAMAWSTLRVPPTLIACVASGCAVANGGSTAAVGLRGQVEGRHGAVPPALDEHQPSFDGEVATDMKIATRIRVRRRK